MGHGETHVSVVSILEPEHLGADGLPAAAVAPDLGGVEDGHGHILPADGVDVLPGGPVGAEQPALLTRMSRWRPALTTSPRRYLTKPSTSAFVGQSSPLVHTNT